MNKSNTPDPHIYIVLAQKNFLSQINKRDVNKNVLQWNTFLMSIAFSNSTSILHNDLF